MTSQDGRYTLVFNGEIYNYRELRAEIGSRYQFRSDSDSEVLLAALLTWGSDGLDKLIGMFSFLLWDGTTRTAFGARDRFGVKPMFYAHDLRGNLLVGSEIKVFHAVHVGLEPDPVAWATFLTGGIYDAGAGTFWKGVSRIQPGHSLTWTPDQGISLQRWYRPNLQEDPRPASAVRSELNELLHDAVSLRFRSDVPVGLLLSGGLDSSLVAAIASRVGMGGQVARCYTFTTDDPTYSELSWSRRVASGFGYQVTAVRLEASDVPHLAQSMMSHQDEPYGGLPTLAAGLIHKRAQHDGVGVLLDGNGLDEGWAGYEYYLTATDEDLIRAPVQGAVQSGGDFSWVLPNFAPESPSPPIRNVFGDGVRELQWRDLTTAKIPRSTRFSDRASMAYGRELREPFLDHRVVELGLRQSPERKISPHGTKLLVRDVAADLLPDEITQASKRPVQTPQREWLRGPLREWAADHIHAAASGLGGIWIDTNKTLTAWESYCSKGASSSYPLWTIISLSLAIELANERRSDRPSPFITA